jgi:hypothetical protein
LFKGIIFGEKWRYLRRRQNYKNKNMKNSNYNNDNNNIDNDFRQMMAGRDNDGEEEWEKKDFYNNNKNKNLDYKNNIFDYLYEYDIYDFGNDDNEIVNDIIIDMEMVKGMEGMELGLEVDLELLNKEKRNRKGIFTEKGKGKGKGNEEILRKKLKRKRKSGMDNLCGCASEASGLMTSWKSKKAV